jgi:glycosyltransferase involved in cell wall biosynthesis
MQVELSVLLPVAKLDKYLKISVDSIRCQTYTNFICLVLLPFELKKNEIELNEICCFDPRFKFLYISLAGIAFALNSALNIVETKYVARMDADDVADPERFFKQISYLKNNPDVKIVGSRVDLIDENNALLKQKFKFFETNTQIRSALTYRMPLCHPSLMFLTATLISVKGYSYGNSAEDHELFLRLMRNIDNQFYNLPDLNFKYRRHPNQLTSDVNSRNSFYDMAGFLFTEFLRTKNFMFIIGMLLNHPIARKIRAHQRKMRSRFGF